MKRLVTEADVRRMARGTRLVVERDMIVTPAARDVALVAGIEVIESACATKPAGGVRGGAELPKLGEGDWLVQVRDGRVTARRVGT